MHDRILAITLLLAYPALSVADTETGADKLTGAQDGLMYSWAKFICGTLPLGLEAEYVKASKLIAEAGSNTEYEERYRQGASVEKWPKVTANADQTIECQKMKEDLEIKVKLAKRWYPDSYK